MLFCVLLTAVAVVAQLLLAGRDGSSPGVAAAAAAAKMVASTGFLAAALSAGPPRTAYAWGVLVALGLSWVGDALLLSRRKGVFLAGLVAFLVAHLTYAAAFALAGVRVGVVVVALLAMAGFAVVVLRWLGPHLSTGMRAPVRLYVNAISLMAALAAGTSVAGGPVAALPAALLFVVSDLAVARDRFVRREARNVLWGRPLYYAAQLIFAATVAAAGR